MPIGRRKFLAISAAAAGYGLCGEAEAVGASPVSMPLWPGTPPAGGGPSGSVNIGKRGSVTNVATPTMDVYLPANPNGSAMLVAAGGGYRHIEIGGEADPAARWLTQRGIVACVLTYRLPAEGWNAGPLAPLQDAQRALRLIHAGKASTVIDARRIGVMGFSAGGHLMGMAATRQGFQSYMPLDEIDRLAPAASLMALAYPIITLLPPYDHTSTRKRLIGDHPTAAEGKEWSVQTYVSPAAPPTLLVQAADDPISNPDNTAIMEAACRSAGVAVERHLLTSGGHGFGMGRPDTPTANWPGEFLEPWLRANRYL